MTKFEYIQFKEIIQQRNFRKNFMVKLAGAGCNIGAFAFIGLALTDLLKGNEHTTFMTPAIFLLALSQLFLAFQSSPTPTLDKLKEDYEAGKEINFEDYENGVKK